MALCSIELFAYPWDIVATGTEPFVDFCTESGINRVHATVTYHSGKFLLPTNPTSRVYFPEPGARYFDAAGVPERAGLNLPASKLIQTDWLRRLANSATAKGIDLSAWTVFFHNSALGAQYPNLTIQNVFGDRYPFALCPTQPAVADHAAALCKSLCSLGIFSSIDLETIGYLGYFHGYHHEVTAIPITFADKFLLSLCFCPACCTAAKDADVEVEQLANDIRRFLSYRMCSDDIPVGSDDRAEQLATLFVMCPQLLRFVRLRMGMVTKLVQRLAEECGSTKLVAFTSGFVGSPSNVWMEGISFEQLKETVDCFHLLAYAADDTKSNSDLVLLLSLLETPDKLNWTINLGLPITTFDQAFARCEYAARKGIRRFSFFNYGLLGNGRLRWIRNLGSKLQESC